MEVQVLSSAPFTSSLLFRPPHFFFKPVRLLSGPNGMLANKPQTDASCVSGLRVTGFLLAEVDWEEAAGDKPPVERHLRPVP